MYHLALVRCQCDGIARPQRGLARRILSGQDLLPAGCLGTCGQYHGSELARAGTLCSHAGAGHRLQIYGWQRRDLHLIAAELLPRRVFQLFGRFAIGIKVRIPAIADDGGNTTLRQCCRQLRNAFGRALRVRRRDGRQVCLQLPHIQRQPVEVGAAIPREQAKIARRLAIGAIG